MNVAGKPTCEAWGAIRGTPDDDSDETVLAHRLPQGALVWKVASFWAAFRLQQECALLRLQQAIPDALACASSGIAHSVLRQRTSKVAQNRRTRLDPDLAHSCTCFSIYRTVSD